MKGNTTYAASIADVHVVIHHHYVNTISCKVLFINEVSITIIILHWVILQ